MGMSTAHGSGGKARAVPQMNVTPLVDVVLVLLIIFMVVTPLLSKQMWLQLPKENAEPAPPSETKSVVLSVKADGTVELNGAAVAKAELEAKIGRVMAARRERPTSPSSSRARLRTDRSAPATGVGSSCSARRR